jgi:hypothetical protein
MRLQQLLNEPLEGGQVERTDELDISLFLVALLFVEE